MTYRNLIKDIIQNVFGGLFDKLSIERKLTDVQIEYMQFGICDYAPRQVEEVPFFLLICNRFKRRAISSALPNQEIH